MAETVCDEVVARPFVPEYNWRSFEKPPAFGRYFRLLGPAARFTIAVRGEMALQVIQARGLRFEPFC